MGYFERRVVKDVSGFNVFGQFWGSIKINYVRNGRQRTRPRLVPRQSDNPRD